MHAEETAHAAQAANAANQTKKDPTPRVTLKVLLLLLVNVTIRIASVIPVDAVLDVFVTSLALRTNGMIRWMVGCDGMMMDVIL